MARLLTLPVALALLLASPGFAQDAGSLDRMKKDLYFLASPECEGRGIETKGIDIAADYIAKELRAAGLKPAGKNGSYFQPFPMFASPVVTEKSTLTFGGPDATTLALAENVDFRPIGYSSGGKVAGGVAFVGYGITTPRLKYDDYAGLDVRGKWVIVLRKNPRPAIDRGKDRFDPTLPDGESSLFAGLRVKLDTAIDHGASGVIFVSDPVSAGDTDPLLAFDTHRYEDMFTRLPVLHMTRSAATKLLKAGLGKTLPELEAEIDKDLKPRSAVLTGWSGFGDIGVERRELATKNVVGYLDGSGPLADETVVIGAHYDHVGYGSGPLSMGGAAAQGRIHFGADDNASGTTAVLELARQFGQMKDRRGRRLVFILFSGEERGLFGSKHYCKEPIFPLNKTVAMVNLDMVGRMRPGPGDWLGITTRPQLQIWGTGSGDTLDRTVDAAELRYGVRVKKVPGGTGPSDHDSFYRKKVPVLFLFTDLHADYHRPSDTADKIDLPGMLTAVNMTADFVTAFSTTPTPPRYIEVPEDPHAGVRVKGIVMRLTPDYSYTGGDGMRVEGVTAGGPAEKGGLKAGDVITDIDGVPVRSVQGYMAALGGKKPGVPLEVTVMREGKKVMLKVTP